jgi:hypothetical protein
VQNSRCRFWVSLTGKRVIYLALGLDRRWTENHPVNRGLIVFYLPEPSFWVVSELRSIHAQLFGPDLPVSLDGSDSHVSSPNLVGQWEWLAMDFQLAL